jgi:hypothetical protein
MARQRFIDDRFPAIDPDDEGRASKLCGAPQRDPRRAAQRDR